MHASSLENMERCIDRFARPLLGRKGRIDVLDVGALDVNGSYRALFSMPGVAYLGADMQEGPGVDLVLADPYRIPFPDGSVDIVVSGQMLEHCEFFWLAFAEMLRVLAPDGYLFLIAPSAGPEHRYPVDCYRYYPDAFRALAKYAGCHLVDVWRDEKGPWCDLVGVFSRHAPFSAERIADEAPSRPDAPVPPAAPELEATRGRAPYLDVLARCHAALSPRLYLEIGVRAGASLRLAAGPAIGVDPRPALDGELPPLATVRAETSDDYFAATPADALPAPLDLAFIDGMHRFEFALRDFMNIEQRSHPATLVAIDDVFPNHAAQASRKRTTANWCGDVWKLMDLLERYRPDLVLLPLDAAPAGLLLVAGLDAGNRVLWDNYNRYCSHYARDFDPLPRILSRRGARDPAAPLVGAALAELARFRDQGVGPADVARAVAALGTS